MFGVANFCFPSRPFCQSTPTSPAPRSSHNTKMIFGRSAAATKEPIEISEAHTAARTTAWENTTTCSLSQRSKLIPGNRSFNLCKRCGAGTSLFIARLSFIEVQNGLSIFMAGGLHDARHQLRRNRRLRLGTAEPPNNEPLKKNELTAVRLSANRVVCLVTKDGSNPPPVD
jgi:hypothetical protein